MKKSLTNFAVVLMLFAACSSPILFGVNVTAQWTGNNPPQSVTYVLEEMVGENWV